MWFKNIIIGLFPIIFKVDYPDWLVLEVGADRPGDIKKITKWLKPDIVVVTAFAKVPVHIEFFENRDQVIREKKYLVESLKREGLLIINGDDEDKKAQYQQWIFDASHLVFQYFVMRILRLRRQHPNKYRSDYKKKHREA